MQTSSRARSKPRESCDHGPPQLRAEPVADNRLRGPSATPRAAEPARCGQERQLTPTRQSPVGCLDRSLVVAKSSDCFGSVTDPETFVEPSIGSGGH